MWEVDPSHRADALELHQLTSEKTAQHERRVRILQRSIMFEQSQMETEFTDVDQVVVRQRKVDYQSTTKAPANGAANGTTKGSEVKEKSEYTPRAVTAVIILNFINLLNYMDRATVAGCV